MIKRPEATTQNKTGISKSFGNIKVVPTTPKTYIVYWGTSEKEEEEPSEPTAGQVMAEMVDVFRK